MKAEISSPNYNLWRITRISVVYRAAFKLDQKNILMTFLSH